MLLKIKKNHARISTKIVTMLQHFFKNFFWKPSKTFYDSWQVFKKLFNNSNKNTLWATQEVVSKLKKNRNFNKLTKKNEKKFWWIGNEMKCLILNPIRNNHLSFIYRFLQKNLINFISNFLSCSFSNSIPFYSGITLGVRYGIPQ